MRISRFFRLFRRPKPLPKTVAEAVDQLVSEMPEDKKAWIRGMNKKDLIQFHHGWGAGIRNSFGLWGRNEALMSSVPEQYWHPDSVSQLIIEGVWESSAARASSHLAYRTNNASCSNPAL